MTKFNHDAEFVDKALGVNMKEFERKLKLAQKRLNEIGAPKASEYLEIISEIMSREELLFMLHMDIERAEAITFRRSDEATVYHQ